MHRIRRTLAALGRMIIDGVAADNGWMWAYGVWYPHPAILNGCGRSPLDRSTPTRG
ncbi:MAG: hypothetical protein QOH17_3672 [Pseudonocardiales bacterium]|nr:hypothetical protein [Pseudonocardiales bacterium]